MDFRGRKVHKGIKATLESRVTKEVKGTKEIKALEFKEQAQARVQAELEGLSGEDLIRKINEMVETGPFAEWWEKMLVMARSVNGN